MNPFGASKVQGQRLEKKEQEEGSQGLSLQSASENSRLLSRAIQAPFYSLLLVDLTSLGPKVCPRPPTNRDRQFARKCASKIHPTAFPITPPDLQVKASIPRSLALGRFSFFSCTNPFLPPCLRSLDSDLHCHDNTLIRFALIDFHTQPHSTKDFEQLLKLQVVAALLKAALHPPPKHLRPQPGVWMLFLALSVGPVTKCL